MLLIYRAFDSFYCSVAFVWDARALNYFVPSEVDRSYLLLTQRSVMTTTFRRGAHLIYSALWRCEGRCDAPETRWTFLLALDHVTSQIFTAESSRHDESLQSFSQHSGCSSIRNICILSRMISQDTIEN